MEFQTHKWLLNFLFILTIVEIVAVGLGGLISMFVLLSLEESRQFFYIPLLSLIGGEVLLVLHLFLIKGLKYDFDEATSVYYRFTKRTASKEKELLSRIEILEKSLRKLDPEFEELIAEEKAKSNKPVPTKPTIVAKKEEPINLKKDINPSIMNNSDSFEIGERVALTTNYIVGGVRYETGSKGTIKDIKKISNFSTYAIEIDGHPNETINVSGDSITSIK